MRSKELKLKGKTVFIDLEINQKGLCFHVKDLSAKDYILLDLSGLDEFLIRLNHFVETNTKHFLKSNKFLFEAKAITHNKRVFFFSFLNLIIFLKIKISFNEVHNYYTLGRRMPTDLDGWRHPKSLYCYSS